MQAIESIDWEQYPEARTMCSVKKALDIIGDRWTLLIIREMFYGSNRFEDFVRHLGISRNILTNRLERLEATDIIYKKLLRKDTDWGEYRLTEKGGDLLVAVCAIMQWGDRWLQEDGVKPIVVYDRETGEPIDEVSVSLNGKPLRIRQVMYRPTV